MNQLKQKPTLAAQLVLTILPTMMAIAFEKTAEAVLVKWANKKEKQERNTNPDVAPRIFDGADGNFSAIIVEIVFPCEIQGLVALEEENGCGHCNHQHSTEGNPSIIVKEKKTTNKNDLQKNKKIIHKRAK